MGAILCPKDGFAVLTMTGGMKLSFSHDADTGHTPPVVGITQEGYIVGLPEESPIDFRFSPSSESWMTVAIYLALAWAAKGEIRSYQGFQAKLAHEFEKSEGRIYLKDHIPPDFPPVAVRHIHRQPNWIGFNRFRDFPGVEFVNPVCDVTPPLDFTCGRKGEADAILRLLLSSPISGNIDHNLWLDDLAHGAVIVAPTMEEATKTAIKVPTRRPETV
jgi:hypothetical protein